MLAGSLLVFLHLVITYIFFAKNKLSPLFNMIVSVFWLLLYTVGAGLVFYNAYGAVSHTCSKVNWASEDGMFVCRTYKAFFAFMIIGWLCQVALLVVDVRAKKAQSTFGKYDKMDNDSLKDLKLSNLDISRDTSTHDIPYGVDVDRARSGSVNSQQHQRFSSPYGAERSQLHRVDDFHYQTPAQESSYQPQQTYQPQQFYQPQQQYANTHYYQPAYDGMRLR